MVSAPNGSAAHRTRPAQRAGMAARGRDRSPVPVTTPLAWRLIMVRSAAAARSSRFLCL